VKQTISSVRSEHPSSARAFANTNLLSLQTLFEGAMMTLQADARSS
jgi:hypothetical protein